VDWPPVDRLRDNELLGAKPSRMGIFPGGWTLQDGLWRLRGQAARKQRQGG
jgi:hypothetical protein